MKIIKTPRLLKILRAAKALVEIMNLSFFVPCLFIWFVPLGNQFSCDFGIDFAIDLSVILKLILGIGFGLHFLPPGPQNLPPVANLQTHKPLSRDK